MALVGTTSLPMLLDLFEAGKLNITPMVTHGMRARRSDILKQSANKEFSPDFKFVDVERAYEVFGKAAETKALKVNIEM